MITDRRPGDIAVSFADPSKAYNELGWKAKRSIEEMCRIHIIGRARILMVIDKSFM